MKTQDKVNAARSVLPRCVFDAAACAQGLMSLREWSYKYDDVRKTYSKEPDHNWASHGADAFCYGAAMLRDYVPEQPSAPQPMVAIQSFTLDKLWADRGHSGSRNRIS